MRFSSAIRVAIRSAGSAPRRPGEPQPQQVHRRHLRGEGLGRGDADLEPGAGEEHGVGVAGRLAAHDVGHGHHLRPVLPRQPHRGKRVGGLARLGDPDHQVVGADHRVAVAVLGGDVHLDRDPRPLLDRVAAHQAGVVAGPAGDDHDPPHPGDEVVGELELGEVHAIHLGEPIRDRLGDRVGLLVDLLQHEGLVATLLGRVLVPVDLLDLAADRGPLGPGDRRAGGVDRDDLAVLDQEHAPGLGEEGRNRRGDEGLPVAQPDDQRALLSRGDERVGMIGVHGRERVVAAQLGERRSHRLGQVALVVALDQVGDDLGVGLGAEPMPLGLELAAQLGVILDDPVEDDLDPALAVPVRVGVLLAHPAVGRPASVGEPDRRRRQRHRNALLVAVEADRGAQVGEVAHRPHRVDPAVLEQRDAGGVVAAVLELLEPRHQQVAAGSLAHVSDDSAHGRR